MNILIFFDFANSILFNLNLVRNLNLFVAGVLTGVLLTCMQDDNFPRIRILSLVMLTLGCLINFLW